MESQYSEREQHRREFETQESDTQQMQKAREEFQKHIQEQSEKTDHAFEKSNEPLKQNRGMQLEVDALTKKLRGIEREKSEICGKIGEIARYARKSNWTGRIDLIKRTSKVGTNPIKLTTL